MSFLATALLSITLAHEAAPPRIDAAAYESPSFQGSAAQIRRALARPGPTRRIRRMAFHGSEVDRNCHTQAISVTSALVMTSCVDRRNQTGWLQIFDRAEDRPRAFAAASGVRLGGTRHPHPAVGQAVVGKGSANGRVLVPVGREPMNVHGPDVRSTLEIRDERGSLVCALTNERRGGLAATALVVSNDRLFALAVGYTDLLVWRIDGVRDGDQCDATLVFAEAGSTAAGAQWRRYQGVAAVVDRSGDLYLFGGRQHRLDVWALRGFGGSDMQVEQVAAMEWRPAAMPIRGVFHEGLSVEPRGDTLRIWAAPRDFWRGTCLPARADRRCTPAVYVVEQRLEDPRVSSR